VVHHIIASDETERSRSSSTPDIRFAYTSDSRSEPAH
jgi:hypothetical protein